MSVAEVDIARLSAHLTTVEDNQRSLQGEQEEMQHEIEQLRQELEKLKADIEMRLGDLDAKRIARNKGASAERGGPSSDAGWGAQDEADTTAHPLERARALFNEHRYEEAQSTLESYITTKLAKSDLAVAQYWLGEVFFAQKRYEESALAFVTGYKADAHGRRTPETLLKLARSLVAVKKRKEARTTLRKLLDDYPNAPTEIRQKADELLKKTA
jgi:tol-pal system protein YbgF